MKLGPKSWGFLHAVVVSREITSTAVEHGLRRMDQRQGAAMMQIEQSFQRQYSGVHGRGNMGCRLERTV